MVGLTDDSSLPDDYSATFKSDHLFIKLREFGQSFVSHRSLTTVRTSLVPSDIHSYILTDLYYFYYLRVVITLSVRA